MTFRTDGLPATVAAPNGNTTTYAYDALGQLTSQDTVAGGTNRALYDWTRNRAGQVLSEASTITGDPANGTVTYGYDPLGRLTGSTISGTTTTYGWDAVPDRTSVQVGAGTAATTTYDAADRPTGGANPTASYSSDDDGRLLSRPGQQLVWDHLGRLTSVKDGSGVTLASYTYDPLDRLRMIDYGAGVRIRFRYVGLSTAVVQWLDDAAGTVTRSVGTGWSGERLLDWTGSGSNIRLYGTNAHHDVTWLASTSGTVLQALRYDPWGTPRSTVPSGYTPFRFQGSWLDDLRDTEATNDLAWVVTRWYAPSLGRFISEDSLLGDPEDPPSRHLYAYGEGEPVGRWDPDGRKSLKSFPIRNPAGFRGKLELAFFIQRKYNYVNALDFAGIDTPIELARLYGDNRGFGIDCARSRACITVDFDRKRVRVRVTDSCGDYTVSVLLGIYIGYHCAQAYPIRATRPLVTRCNNHGCYRFKSEHVNLVSVRESTRGKLDIRWDVTQSRLPVFRPDFTVNGRMVVTPRALPLVRKPRLELWADGFPSEELYASGSGAPRGRVHKYAESTKRDAWKDMRRGRADYHVSMDLPIQNRP